MTTFTKESGLVLIADSPKGAIWKANTKTGDYEVAMNHTTMMPAKVQTLPLGINGLKVVNGYVYYSSTTRMEFCRVKVDDDATPAGDFEVIASGFLHDNIEVDSDGTAYIATDPQNSVVRISPSGQISLVAGGQLSTQMPGPTCCRLTEDGTTLYVGTSGGQVAPVLGTFKEPGKIVKISFA
jgi:sugar lactone lactonase YvrE